ncbi:hypothetical protein LZL87_013493 [Fusarium oxysporum]|nr:hypothetical protein LZL87_013493 [Fusarium oxysporum]
MGRHQEAKRFDSFTPKAVHWYFDIRDGHYGWIKPEDTVNVDEGGLDSLVVGSADPKRKAVQIVKQKNRYNVDEVGIIEGIGLNGLSLSHKDKKPLKRAYRKFLSDLASIADSSHIGKITFLYNYDKALKEAITKLNALAGWKATGLWPVNLAKVLMNPMVTQTPETPAPAVTAISLAKEKNLSLPKTPQSFVQLRRALQAVPAAVTTDPTVRLLFRKIGSQLDTHTFEIKRQKRDIMIMQLEKEESHI